MCSRMLEVLNELLPCWHVLSCTIYGIFDIVVYHVASRPKVLFREARAWLATSRGLAAFHPGGVEAGMRREPRSLRYAHSMRWDAHAHRSAPPLLHLTHVQPTSAYATTSMITRCGEGDQVVGWHVGGSPSMVMMRYVTNRSTLPRPCDPKGYLTGAVDDLRLQVLSGPFRRRLSTFVPDFLHGLDQPRSDGRYAATAAPQFEPQVELTLAWTPFWGVPLACLDPARRAWSSTFLPAPVRRKQAQHTPIPPRTQIIVDPGLRCALPPDTTHWAHPQLTDPQ